jgi:hypothetical protein
VAVQYCPSCNIDVVVPAEHLTYAYHHSSIIFLTEWLALFQLGFQCRFFGEWHRYFIYICACLGSMYLKLLLFWRS